jgi:hypothetical protein
VGGVVEAVLDVDEDEGGVGCGARGRRGRHCRLVGV